MRPIISNGRLMIPVAIHHDGIIGDGLVEMKPDDPRYAETLAWARREELARNETPTSTATSSATSTPPPSTPPPRPTTSPGWFVPVPPPPGTPVEGSGTAPDLPTSTVPLPPRPTAPCPRCGRENDVTSLFCGHCHVFIEEGGETRDSGPPQAPARPWVPVLVKTVPPRIPPAPEMPPEVAARLGLAVTTSSTSSTERPVSSWPLQPIRREPVSHSHHLAPDRVTRFELPTAFLARYGTAGSEAVDAILTSRHVVDMHIALEERHAAITFTTWEKMTWPMGMPGRMEHIEILSTRSRPLALADLIDALPWELLEDAAIRDENVEGVCIPAVESFFQKLTHRRFTLLRDHAAALQHCAAHEIPVDAVARLFAPPVFAAQQARFFIASGDSVQDVRVDRQAGEATWATVAVFHDPRAPRT